jgi:cytochrome c553
MAGMGWYGVGARKSGPLGVAILLGAIAGSDTPTGCSCCSEEGALKGFVSFAGIFLVTLVWLPAASGQSAGQEQAEFFEKRVRPLLVTRCQACHDAARHTAGLDLTSAAGLRKGADSGPVFLTGDVENSRLVRAVGYQERIKMPPTGRLKDEEIAVLREWVRMGAPWPSPQNGSAGAPEQGYSRAQREFWSFRPLKRVAPPRVKDEAWVFSPIDRFILARLEERGLRPAPPADKVTLIRRAALDLTGLPPAEQDVRSFLADNSPAAFETVVDRLLASPHYGERWGRHWLDVARYADSTGADEDHRYPYAWRYRDYIIDAFNRDLPYNRFMHEQIAGDLLPAADGSGVNTTGIVATGFLALGPKLIAEQDKVKMFYDIVDEQIDVTGKAFLGLTLACARCHDHKFDPISTRDYYSLASIFASTKQLAKLEGTVSKLYFAPLVPKQVADRYGGHQKKIEDKQREIDELNGEEAGRYRDTLAPRLAEYMLAARKVYAGGATAPDAARERSLDAGVLSRWVDYLKPSKERRAHLEPWYNSSPEELLAAAHRYQEEFMAVASERTRAQGEWKARAEAVRARGQEPPEAPKFQPGDNRFFTEVSTAKGPFALPEKEREKVFSASGRARAEELKAELKRLKDSAPSEPPLACGVAEGKNVDQCVFVRGNPEALGEPVAKRLPVVLAGEVQPPIGEGSGRRELAQWLSDARHPLPARVMVNRIWQGHFVQGLVRTPSNFGVTGERPTHPELLDWLAAEFIARGWSVKAMHRLMILSSTYQMSSETEPEKLEKDADNRLLSHFPMRRMSIEEIRDSLLNLDGTLDLTMGGTLQTGQGTDKEFSDDRKSLNPDASKRRTVYLPLRRSNLPSLFTQFDFGDATTSNETRTQTNVAPQALFMMNSQFVAERTRSMAQKLLRTERDDARRVERAWFAVLGRRPEPKEAKEALRYIDEFPTGGDDGGRLRAWASWCRTLVASNDFIYVH